jgi:NAD(P)-dependent dehydrogenase (short-subunit alcohol dehydrogenase family)
MAALTGRHVLITGGGSGIGAAVAAKLAAEGAAITLAGRRLHALEAVAATLAKATVCPTDVTNAEDCARLAAHARKTHGPIDIVVANAGGAMSRPFNRTDQAHWQDIIDVNLTGTFLTVQAALADLVRPADSDQPPLRRIIFVASTAGLKGYPYVAPYVAAKHGVVGLARALAVEYAKTPLTVNAVCPGYVETPLFEATLANIVAKTGRTRAQAQADLLQSNPQGRVIAVAEVAATVAWLCQPLACSVTGQAIAVSGGEI